MDERERSRHEIFGEMAVDERTREFLGGVDELLLKRFVEQEKGTTLQLGCAATELTEGLLRKVSGSAKLVVIDPRLPLLDTARVKVGGRYPGRVFFKSDLDWKKRLPFDDEVFNTVLSSLFWDEAPNRHRLLGDLYRVLLPGGSLLLTIPLEDSFHEFYDLYSETITKFDLLHLVPALTTAQGHHPGEEKMLQLLEQSGFSLCRATAVDTAIEFRTSKEFVASPLVAAMWLPAWSEIGGDETERILWHLREAADRYYAGRPFRLTVRIGVLSGIK